MLDAGSLQEALYLVMILIRRASSAERRQDNKECVPSLSVLLYRCILGPENFRVLPHAFVVTKLTTSSDTSNQSELVDTNMKTVPLGESEYGAVLESSTESAFTLRWTEKVVLACLMLMGFYTSGEAIGISIPLAVCTVEFGSWYRSKRY